MAPNNKVLTDIYIERIFSLLTQGYSFLFETGSKEGHWNEVRSTALAGTESVNEVWQFFKGSSEPIYTPVLEEVGV